VSSQLLSASIALVALAFFSLSETAITTLWPWKVRVRTARHHTARSFLYALPAKAKRRRPDSCRSTPSTC
jgi:CBS domain containing-hemolysin-like protein